MQNTIIKASAGTGKTYRLSNRYIGILFHGVYPETILASTFTRKAAGEILERILTRLAGAALSDKKHVELNEALQHDGLPKCLDAAALQTMTANLARNLYKLRISTLDSLFNQLATVFSLELGLPPGWSILDEAAFSRIVQEAVGDVLAFSERNEAKNLLHLFNKGETNPKITEGLVELAKKYMPLIRETKDRPEIWEHEHLKRLELEEDELQSVLVKLPNAEVPKNKDGREPKAFI
jgi:ATP-dependent exoDNAse (exonuclease V) beta subunit